MHQQNRGDENNFHNKTPTSGGNILIFMLPKHEKGEETASFVIHERKKTSKSFFFDIRRRKKRNPHRNIFIEKTFSGWFTI